MTTFGIAACSASIVNSTGSVFKMYPVGAFVSTNWYVPGASSGAVTSPASFDTSFSITVLPSASITLNSAFSKTFPSTSTFVNTALAL